MKEVWIFGDSYAQKEPAIFKSTKNLTNLTDSSFTTWPNQLEKKYNIKNFAKGGTGPSWSLNKLLEQIENTDKNNLKNINVIFLVSAIWRLDLLFYKSESDQFLTTIIPSEELWNIKKTKEIKKAVSPYSAQKNFVKDLWKYYLLTDTYEKIELTKILGAVNLYSSFFEKILVWPIFNKFKTDINYSNNNFYYINNLLFDIEKDPYGCGYDPRRNHLSKENHNIMTQQLTNWIDNCKIIDINEFKTVVYK